MKILILSNKVPFPPRDGGALATADMIRGLAAAGHRVTLLAINTSRHPFTGRVSDIESSFNIRFSTVKLDTSIRICRAWKNFFFSHLPYNIERFWSEQIKEYIKRHLEEETYDMVQLEGLAMALYLPVLRKMHNGPVSLRAHNAEHEIWERNSAQSGFFLKRLYLRVLARRIRRFEHSVLQNTDLLVPISDRDAETFKKLGYKGPCKVIPCGFSPVERTGPLTGDPSLVFIGALDWMPNQEGLKWFLREVWPVLHRHNRSLQFHVAGRNAPASVGRDCRRPGVHFFGETGDSQQFLAPGWVMVVPLFAGSGIRIKIIEGMALAKAIVATSVAAEGIPAVHGEHLLIADDKESFVNGILPLLADREKIRVMGEKARELVREKFDTFVLSAELTDFYMNHGK